MPKEKRIAEPGPVYGTLAIDLSEPLVIQHDGKPVAVMLAYEDYERLKVIAGASAQQRESAWQELDEILAQVHARTSVLSPEEIEAEITAAAQEAKEERNARRRRG
jgi:PHD/YefM family antitoxin component YafN of YafNO toxin-antitoxin module